MMLIVAGLLFFLYAVCCLAKGLFLLLKALYIRHLAGSKEIDRAYEKYFLIHSEDYQKFQDQADREIKDILKN